MDLDIPKREKKKEEGGEGEPFRFIKVPNRRRIEVSTKHYLFTSITR